MKVLKGIFYTISALIIALCAFILICAVNPALTESLVNTIKGVKFLSGLAKMLDKSGDDTSDVIDLVETPDGDLQIIVPADSIDEEPEIVEVPSDGNIITNLPDEMSKLTGYEPITSEEEKVTDEVAESLKKTLGTGETGEGFTFDALMYPFFAMLNADEQDVYRQIYANALANNSTFAPVKAITPSQLSNIFEAVVNDHPELFYLETSYQVKYTKTGSVVEIQLAYYTLVNDITSAKQTFSNAAKAVIAGAQDLSSDYEKEKYVHDYLIQNVVYDAGASLGQSAYSALVNGKTVCAGYARANQYILQQLKIPCYYCTGYAGEDHAWNIVKLSDGYYNEDITWDDTEPSTYDYFNKSDKDFASTHIRTSLSVNLPPCGGGAYSGLESAGPSEVEAGDPSTVADSNTEGPLRYDDLYPDTSKKDETAEPQNNSTSTETDNSALIAALKELGYKETDADWTMDEYYADCKKKLVAAGAGDQHFQTIVPEALFSKIETAYGKGDYKKGYVEEALKSLGMDHFTILLQAERMGKGFYRLYHNVVSWKENTEDTKTTTDTTSGSSDNKDNTNNNSNTNTDTNTNGNTSTNTDTNTNKNTNTNTNTDTSTNTNTNTSTNTNTNTSTNTDTNTNTAATTPTENEKKALEKAKEYLSKAAYSESALKKLLTDTDKFTDAEASYAIKNCGADWKEQAVKKAKGYLSTITKKEDMINKLKEDGFTDEQAQYGAEQNGFK